MFKWITSCLYFFLPAYFTNMTPPLAKKAGIFNFLDKPVDFNKKFNGQRILGSHKTWRGFILGIIIGVLVSFVQSYLYKFSSVQKISFFDYQKINIFLLGFLMSFGAVCGDLFFSFIKRRLKLKPGTRFIPFDQINYLIGAAFFISLTPFFKVDILVWLTLLVLNFFLHIIINRLGYHLKLHKAKW
jgi:CDP-2,3-bis-(O-geranylgeranyl)-sn-glycerol synthase